MEAIKPRDFIEGQFVSMCAQLMWRYRTLGIYYERLLAQARDEGMEHLLAGPEMSRIEAPIETDKRAHERRQCADEMVSIEETQGLSANAFRQGVRIG